MQTQKKYLIIGCGLIGGSIARKLRVIDQDCIIDYIDKEEINAGFLSKYEYNFQKERLNDLLYDCVFFSVNCFPATFKTKIFVTLFSFAEKLDYNAPWMPYVPQIGFHPMAGSEKSGFKNSSQTLFNGCNYSIIQYENDEIHAEILKEVAPLFKAITNREEDVASVTPELHNKYVAYTSHLLHFLALKMPRFAELPYFQRISQSDKEMWEVIFRKNEVNIFNALQWFMQCLTGDNTPLLESFNTLSFDCKVAMTIENICESIPKNFKGTALKEVSDYLIV